MNRKDFLKTLALFPFAAGAMTPLTSLKGFLESFGEEDEKLPALFIGHGSPTNGIEDNDFSRRWKALGQEIPKPKAVLVVSAHWLTNGTHITAMSNPKTIHDFGGFSDELHAVQYPAPGSPQLAKEMQQIIKKTNLHLDHDWGLDHGTWTIVRHMYPNADIPVLQLSIDYSKPPQYHYELAKDLAALRKKGVLIIGSGNMVHNLGMIAWDKLNADAYGYDWALELNDVFKKHITDRNHANLIAYDKLHKSAKLAIPTPDHYYPLLYILGLQDDKDKATFFNDKAVAGSLTMTSVKLSA